MKIILKIMGIMLLLCLVIAGGYVGYLLLTYARIDDYQTIEEQNNPTNTLTSQQAYSLLTYNIGFGAYNPDFSFFMDTGEMKDGTLTRGASGSATAYPTLVQNLEGILQVSNEQAANFYFFQEVDQKATRSFGVDEVALIQENFINDGSAFALNFHSAFLFYPFTNPIGKSDAGLLTISDAMVRENIRRSLPIDDSLINRYFDLDRAVLISYLPVEGGKELVLINAHLSAYDEGGVQRKRQLEVLNQIMEEEYNKGNYVIVGGDFNQILEHNADYFPSEQQVPTWISMLEASELAANFSVVPATNGDQVATVRSSDMPYRAGVNYTAIIDGFIVSNNIEASSTIIDTNYQYSDHNPVKLNFTLK